jgi:hypothetical protein
LSGLTSIPEGFNPTVGGYLYLSGLTSKKTPITQFEIELKIQWKGGLFRIFDGIFCEVLSKRKNVFKVKAGCKIQYVIQHGSYFSHGDTIKQARESLIYKISDRDTSEFEKLTLKSVLSKEEAIKMYRVVTGACETGTRYFVEGLRTTKKSVTVKEIIDLTKGRYGNDRLVAFFK